jgi:hypothetical protein
MGSSDGTIVGTTKVIDHGPSNERWDLVMLGDGFRAADQAAYEAAVTTFVTTLQATAPFDTAWDRVNVHRIDVHSTDAGADNPATCGADAPEPETTVATYFDARFCGDGSTRRLLVCDAAAVVTTVNARVPNWDAILVIVNTPIYGGSGGQEVATYSLDPTAHEIALHEMGHSAFKLADEYDNLQGCTSGETGHDHHDATEPTEPNVTVEVDRAKLKWRHLVVPATKVPTTSNADCTKCDPQTSPVAVGTVGLFEGAHYMHCGAFRPEFNCRMRTLGQPFCKVCQERIRAKLGTTSKSMCFVATAVYGDAHHPDVATLRAWRDRHLARGHPAMRTLSAAYERAGPPIARRVAARPRLAAPLRRAFLAPLARILRRRERG